MALIIHGQIVTPDGWFDDGAIFFQNGLIEAIGSTDQLIKNYPDADIIDAQGGLVMPGLINAHMHLYSTFARGMALGGDPASNFSEILDTLWWRLDKALTDDDIYYSALIPLIECVKCGTTTIFDHHASPMNVPGSLARVAEAAHKIGIRTSVCYEVSDRDGDDVAQAGIDENARAIKAYQFDATVRGMVGLHASFTCCDATVERAVTVAKDLGVGCHIHVAEGEADLVDAKKKYGCGVVERLYDRGVLGPRSIAAHCIHISDHEIDILRDSQTNVVHNPESNMNNAVGCARVIDMLAKGVRVGLGTDGMTSDMFRESKVANIIHKHASHDPRVGFDETLTMQLNHNAAIASAIFSQPVGKLEKGAVADIIILDYKTPTPMCTDNFGGHFLFGLSALDVDTTIVHGKVLMRHRELQGIDEAAITARSRELAAQLWKRL